MYWPPKEKLAGKHQSRYECFPDDKRHPPRMTELLEEQNLKEIQDKHKGVELQLLGIK